jgi:hypothetical protein
VILSSDPLFCVSKLLARLRRILSVVQGLMGSLVHSFFAYRVYAFTQSRVWPCLIGVSALPALGRSSRRSGCDHRSFRRRGCDWNVCRVRAEPSVRPAKRARDGLARVQRRGGCDHHAGNVPPVPQGVCTHARERRAEFDLVQRRGNFRHTDNILDRLVLRESLLHECAALAHKYC